MVTTEGEKDGLRMTNEKKTCQGVHILGYDAMLGLASAAHTFSL